MYHDLVQLAGLSTEGSAVAPLPIDIKDNEPLSLILYNAREFARSLGVTSASYRLVPSYHSQLDKSAILYHFGFPAEWVALYDDDHAFRQHDPIADYVTRTGKAMTWKQAVEAQKLTPEQAAFAQSMKDHGLIDGWAVPFYGPRGREAYVTYSLGREFTDADTTILEVLTNYTRVFHEKIIRLAESNTGQIRKFSKREKEVLTWIARGKSNSDIATILGLSPATIGTFVQRIFRKLEVNDRMAATLKGLQNGIVRL